jgi:deoxyribose-phosphate aldolase
MEKDASIDADLGSYEGKYPRDLFNKTVIVNEQAMGRVAKETEDQIVVFSDSGNLRFDIPKSKIALSGGSIVVGEPLEQYAVDKDAPMPEGKSLRPSAEEILQKAGDVPAASEKYSPVEGPTLPIEERKPTIVEEKVRDAATEVKTSVGYELGQASKTVKEKMRDVGEAVMNVDVEGGANKIKDFAQSGAEAAKEKMGTAQSNAEAGLSSENMMKFEQEAKQSSTETDLGSYEGKYPKDLFNKTVVVNNRPMGRVAKETEDQIVVFSDSGNLRFDIPKSKIALSGGSIVVGEGLELYAVDKDAPMPEDRALRASVQEIREKAGDVPEGPTLPIEERKPTIVEEKVRDAATEVKTSVGYELGQASKTVKEKMRDVGEAVMNVDVEGGARQAAGGIKDFAQSGAEAAKEKMGTAQSSSEAGLSVDNMMKFEKEAKQSSTETDLGSYEGKYPKGFFNKTVVVNNRPIGRVAKETDNVIVVFSDTDSSIRFDIPKSEISTAGASVIASEDLLFRYRAHRDAPMPEDRALRASVQEIRAAATEQLEIEKKSTTADSVMEEGRQLATVPRPETTSVSRPEGYIDTESEISKKMKGALAELKEIIVAGTKVAKKKAKQAQENAAEKRAEMDGEAISRMGDLAMRFADSFEDILSEIRTRTYTEQVQIYTGFIKLMDQQRTLVLARREFAERLKDSVNVSVVGPQDQDMKTRELKAPPELPEELEGNRSLSEGKSTTTTTAKRRKRISSSRTTRRKA